MLNTLFITSSRNEVRFTSKLSGKIIHSLFSVRQTEHSLIIMKCILSTKHFLLTQSLDINCVLSVKSFTNLSNRLLKNKITNLDNVIISKWEAIFPSTIGRVNKS